VYFKAIFKAPSAEREGEEVVLGKSPYSAVYILLDGEDIYLAEGGPIEEDLRLRGTFSAATGVFTEQEFEEAYVGNQKEYFEYTLEGTFNPFPDFGVQEFEVTAKGNTLSR